MQSGGDHRGADRKFTAGKTRRVVSGVTICVMMPTALYNRDILRLAASIPHLGRLERAQASAEKRSPVCGSWVAVDVALDDEGRVAALGQEVKACALGQASAALMGAGVLGREPAELVEARDALRSEEHTSELQSLMRISYAVFCLKKKKQENKRHIYTTTH